MFLSGNPCWLDMFPSDAKRVDSFWNWAGRNLDIIHLDLRQFCPPLGDRDTGALAPPVTNLLRRLERLRVDGGSYVLSDLIPFLDFLKTLTFISSDRKNDRYEARQIATTHSANSDPPLLDRLENLRVWQAHPPSSI